MDKEKKIKLFYRAALISGIFCGVVALLLILNFWHMKQNEPLESQTIEALVKRLSQEPNNEEMKQEIRNFDLLARKAYFTSRWQVKTGTWLLLIGGIVLAVSLKFYTDLRAAIEPPEEKTEELLKARANAQYWLFLSGGLILGLSLVAAILTNDYLTDYERMAGSGEPVEEIGGVEVVEVFPGEQSTPAESAAAGDSIPDVAAAETEADQVEPAAVKAPVSAPSGIAFNRDNFKKNHATFRGYMGQGVSYHKNIPESWNGPSGQNVKWKVAFSKPGYNSPVIWDDKIFISGGDKAACIVACYNRNTGQLIWEQEVKDIPGSPPTPPRVTDDTGLAASTMVVDGNRVYAIFATGNIVAFDMKGKQLWGRNLGVPNNHYGHSSSLQVWENRIVVQYDTNTKGRMLALNTLNGETIWDVDRPVHISWASPALIEVDGKIQVVTSADPYVSGHDLQTGAEIWKVEAMMGEVGPSVAFDGGLVYASQEYARTVAIDPRSSEEFVWEDDEYMSEVGSPVAHNGLMYMATSFGVVVCYDGKTGEKQWEKEFDDEIWSSPVIAEGKVYVIDKGGITHIIKADRTGAIIAEPELGEAGFALPAFADGVVYLRGTKNLYCIGK
ncbi:MAG: PQQ-binding-like beta-propeller repeat protein [Bacteroidetes bacterium]|nr:PQQ-binding-like beta-propeller repeat protein [Bacteroidota bacterium]